MDPLPNKFIVEVVDLKSVRVHLREDNDLRSLEVLDMIIRQGTLNLSAVDIAAIRNRDVQPTEVAPPESDVCDCGKIEHGRHHMLCPALKSKS